MKKEKESKLAYGFFSSWWCPRVSVLELTGIQMWTGTIYSGVCFFISLFWGHLMPFVCQLLTLEPPEDKHGALLKRLFGSSFENHAHYYSLILAVTREKNVTEAAKRKFFTV